MRADDVGNDYQIAVGLKAHSQRPQNLCLIEYIDIIVDNDDELDIRVRYKGRQSRLLRLALGPFFDRDVTMRPRGAGDRHIDAGGAGNRFLNALVQASQPRRGADDIVLKVGAVDALINGIFPHRDRRDFDIGLFPLFIIVVRPFTERTLVLPLFWRHNALDDDFAVCRHHEIYRFGLDHFQRFAKKSAGNLQFLTNAGLLGDGGQIQRRMVADGEGDFHGLVVVFVLRPNVVAMISVIDHQSELPLALFLVPVDAHVHRVGAALFADQRGGVDISAGVAFVDG